MPTITTIFSDIGGVLLTNGWDHQLRKTAAETFDLDYEEMNERHHQTFDTYESGKLTLDEYLRRVVFYQQREFTREQFISFIQNQWKELPSMLGLLRRLKERHHLKITAVSNEGREFMLQRMQMFPLKEIIDIYIVSSFIHLRKPDRDMFRLALDISQVSPGEVVYLEDRPMFVDVAASMGIHGIHHTSYESTAAALGAMGLRPD